MKLARIAIDRPVTIYMFYFAVILLGVRLAPRAVASTSCPTSATRACRSIPTTRASRPRRSRRSSPQPLESAVSRIPGLRRVESVSKEGVSLSDPRVRLGHEHGLHHAPRPGTARQRPRPLPRGRREPDDHRPRPAEQADHDPGRLRRPEPPRAQGAGRGAHQAAPRADRGHRLGRDHRRRRARDPGRGRPAEARPLRADRRRRRHPRSTPSTATSRAGRSAKASSSTPSASSASSSRWTRSARSASTRPRRAASSASATSPRIDDAVKERQGMTRLDGAREHRPPRPQGVRRATRSRSPSSPATSSPRSGTKIPRSSSISSSRAGQVHRGRHRLGQGRAHPGRDPGLPALLIFLQEWKTPLIIDTVIPISVIGDVQPALLRQYHPQYHVARRPGPGGGHARRLRRRRLGEHLPPPQPGEER